MHRLKLPGVLALLVGAVLFSLPAWASRFTFRREGTGEVERGIVVSHGMPLFEITAYAGGYSPARRAQIIAARLEQLSASHQLAPEMFSVGYRNGQVILQQHEHTEHPSHTVVTIDRRLARDGQVERLAQWWLALLRDHLCLALGRPPTHTAGTPVGAIFQKLYAKLVYPAQPVPSEQIERAFAALSESEQELFHAAAHAVPDTYHPDRAIVVEVPPAGEAAPLHGEGGAGQQRPTPRPLESQAGSFVPEKKPPPGEADHPRDATTAAEPRLTPVPRGLSPRDRVQIAVTTDGLLEAVWLSTEQPIESVTFALLDAEGKSLATRQRTRAPFTIRFPEPANSYFSAGLSHVQVTVEFTDGARTEVVVPFRKLVPKGSTGEAH